MAGARVVGKVAIKAIPDVRGFNKSLVSDLEKVAEKSILIPVELEDKSFDSMKKKIEKQAERMKIRLKPEFDDTEFKSDIDKIEKENKPKVKVEVDADEANLKRNERIIKDSFDRIELMQREMQRKLERDAERGIGMDTDYMNRVVDRFKDTVARLQDEAEVKYELELPPEQIDKVERQFEGLFLEYDGKNIEVEATLQRFLASRDLDWLTRPRTVEIFTKINHASAAATAAAIAALSGGRLASDIGNDMWTFFRDLDKNLPMLSVAGTSMTALAGTIFGVTSSLVSFGAGLGQIMPLMLTLPGLTMGAVAATVALGVAWKDVKTELASLEAPFKNLGDLMSRGYWSEARDPITEFVNELMPQMETALGSASKALGGFTGALATSFGQEFANGRFESIFDTFSEGFRVLEQGTDGFAGAIVNMAQIAGDYWPRLAEWINRTAGTFDQWLTDISTDGRLSEWMETGIDSLYDLWGGLEAGGRILRGLWNAADMAGATAMLGFRRQMEEWDELVNSASSQRALRDWFEGGREAAAGLGDAIELIFAPFARNSSLMKDVFSQAGDSVRELGRFIGEVFGRQSALAGFDRGLQGIEDAFVRMQEAAGPLGSFVGTTATTVGRLAEAISGPLSIAFSTVLPRAEEVLMDVLRAADALSAAFSDLLSTDEFAGFMDDVVALADTLADLAVDAAPLVGGVLTGLVGVLDALGPAGIVAIASVVSLGGALVGAASGAIRLVEAFNIVAPAGGRVQTALGNIAGSAGGMRGALSNVTNFLTSPWTLALGGAVFVLQRLEEGMERTKATSAEFEALIRGNASAMELFTAAQPSGDLRTFDFDGTDAATFEDYLGRITNKSENMWAALDPSNFALDNSGFHAALTDLDGLLAGMDFEQLSSGFQTVADGMGLSQAGAENLLASMPQVEDAVLRYASANDLLVTGTDGSIDRARTLAVVMGELAPAADVANAATALTAEQLMATAGSADEALAALQGLNDQMWGSIDAEAAYQESIDNVTNALANGLDPAISDVTGDFDLAEASGRRGSEMLRDMVDAANANAQAMLENGDMTRDEFVAAQDAARQSIYDTAIQMGVSKEQARLYADGLAAIPNHILTQIEAQTAAAQQAIDNFILRNDGRVIRIDTATGGVATRQNSSVMYGRARGGIIPGAPSSRDNIIAALATGEYVVNARMTQKYLPMLEAINSGTFPIDRGGQPTRYDGASARVDASALSSLGGGGGSVGGSPLVGNLTMVSSGDTRTDIDDVMFRLRSMSRGGR